MLHAGKNPACRRLFAAALLVTVLAPSVPARTGEEQGASAKSAGDQPDAFQVKADKIRSRLDHLYGEDFWLYFCDDGVMPRPYLVAAQNKKSFDPETLEREYADIFGNLYEVFYKEYGELLELDPVTEPVPVLIFDSKEAYEEVRKEKPELGLEDPEFIAGYYSPASGELVQWRQEDLWKVMFHEGTHQLVDFCAKKFNTPQFQETPWFQEGIADYMGGHKRKLSYSEEKQAFVNEFTLGQFIQDRFSVLQGALNSGEILPLKDLTHMSFLDFKAAQNNQSGSTRNQMTTGLVYAQGWALVMFLNTYQDAKYRGDFEKYFQREIRGEAGGAAFSEIFVLETDADWEDFDAEFHEFINTDLRRMRLKK